ncbi:MAG: hypothetical protein HY698_07245 [Deltaproteobacteria bacterium]|nr:hypothetical protein [Deltaproteobacteria bacterium]
MRISWSKDAGRAGAAFLVALFLLPNPSAWAWEADSTHAGLTEQAALASRLHRALAQAHGQSQGLYQVLGIPRGDATKALYQKLGAISPTVGVVPDPRGEQAALAWLVAGAVLEDIPPERGRHHFFDPASGLGLTPPKPGFLGAIVSLAKRLLLGVQVLASGVPAPSWIEAEKNDLNLDRFWLELELSAAARTSKERQAHLARALIVAGAMLHVLQDVGSPSRARNDLDEHLRPLGGGRTDRGSRFERLAALAFGRLGVPAPGTPVRRFHARDFFISDGQGLAEVTAARWFSSGTLPRTIDLRDAAGSLPGLLTKALRRPAPVVTSVDLRGAESPEGVVIAGPFGACLANARKVNMSLEWFLSDACALSQLAVILPTVGSYSAGFLDWLFRGSLTLSPDGSIRNAGVALGAGVVTLHAEDKEGIRTPLAAPISIPFGAVSAEIGRFAAPEGTALVVATFRGLDEAGDAVVAAGTLDLR